MRLTPADIENKTFSTALRGYDLDEVDDFLDELVVTVRDLEDELEQTRARIAGEEGGRAHPAGGDEAAVGRVLLAAQETADRLVMEARQEAESILGEARAEAERMLSEARDRVGDLESEKAELRAEAAEELSEMREAIDRLRGRLAELRVHMETDADAMETAVEETERALGPPSPADETPDGEAMVEPAQGSEHGEEASPIADSGPGLFETEWDDALDDEEDLVDLDDDDS